MHLAFDPTLANLLAEIGHAAAGAGVRAWVVGGVVRDALRGTSNRDVDVTVEGDAPALVAALQRRWNAPLQQHDAFTTATLLRDDGFNVDVVQARSETYACRGALPTVRPGTLDEDLRRRDFSVNAMAASLAPEEFGALVDPLGGEADLRSGVLRILHPASFEDDATRLARAPRYAVRCGLEPDALTDEAARAAVADGALMAVSADRRRREVEITCAERQWAEMLAWLNRWGYWEGLAEGFRPDAAVLRRIDVARGWCERNTAEPVPPPDEARWLGLLAAAPEALYPHLSVKPAEADTVQRARRIAGALDGPEDGAWQRAMDAEPAAALMLALAMARDDSQKRRLTQYWQAIRPVRLSVTGDVLLALGASPGPALGEALRRTLDAVRAGQVAGRDAEAALAMEIWRRLSGA